MLQPMITEPTHIRPFEEILTMEFYYNMLNISLDLMIIIIEIATTTHKVFPFLFAEHHIRNNDPLV